MFIVRWHFAEFSLPQCYNPVPSGQTFEGAETEGNPRFGYVCFDGKGEKFWHVLEMIISESGLFASRLAIRSLCHALVFEADKGCKDL